MPLSKFTIEDSRHNRFSSTQSETKLPLFQQLQLLFYKQQSCRSASCIMISLLLNKRLYRQLQAQKFTVTLNEGLLLTACSETLTALYKHKYSVCVLVLWKDSQEIKNVIPVTYKPVR